MVSSILLRLRARLVMYEFILSKGNIQDACIGPFSIIFSAICRRICVVILANHNGQSLSNNDIDTFTFSTSSPTSSFR